MFVELLAATLIGSQSPAVDLLVWGEKRHFDLAVVSGSRCRYADGRAAYLLQTSTPGEFIFVLRTKGELERGDRVAVRRDGSLSFEINGGLASYASFSRAVEDLLRARRLAITPTTYRHFITQKPEEPCRHKAYDADPHRG